MELKTLHLKNLGDSKQWRLCRTTLKEYMESLGNKFSDFRIQRKIVKNTYLDKLQETILLGEPMPTITLIAYNFDNQEGTSLSSGNFDILDGLQRTYRLWVIWMLHQIKSEKGLNDSLQLYKYVSETENGNPLFNSDFVTYKLIRGLFEEKGKRSVLDRLIEEFSTYDVYFYIWSGLNENDIINKMLVLNAGQKSVSSTHQYELLFLHFFDRGLQYNQAIKIYRERDNADFTRVKKGEERHVGEYCMSSIVIALQSFIQEKPIRVTPANQIENEKIENDSNISQYFSQEVLSHFIDQIYSIDKSYNQIADMVKWFGKDTTMSGLFAAIGKSLENKSVADITQIAKTVTDRNIDFKLKDFVQEYNNLASTKINVGQYVRNAIFNYSYAYLKKFPISWKEAFNKGKDNEKE